MALQVASYWSLVISMPWIGKWRRVKFSNWKSGEDGDVLSWRIVGSKIIEFRHFLCNIKYQLSV